MLAIGASERDIRAAAAQVGVALRSGSTWRHAAGQGDLWPASAPKSRGPACPAFRFQLVTLSERTTSGRIKRGTITRYRRFSTYPRQARMYNRETGEWTFGAEFYPTIPGAVCWHGHRDFMRALFARCPELELRTALATYKGAADFERKFEDTGWQEVGRGVTLRDTCDCLNASVARGGR